MSQAEPTCPVCRQPVRSAPVQQFDVVQTANHWCPEVRNPDRHRRLVANIRRLWNGADHQAIYRCEHCGFGFGWPFVGGDDEFYNIQHEQADYPFWRWEYDLTIQHARGVSGPDRRVLDIGAGDGKFLLGMPDGWERYAVESTEYMRGILESRGIRVIRDLKAACAEHAGRFQIITLFQALHQIRDFHDVLEACRSLLAPDGVLVVSCPNGDEMFEWQKATGYPDMPPAHINKFSANSMRLAMEQHRLKVDRSLVQPPRWKRVPYTIYLRLRAKAASNPRSLAARVYRLESRTARKYLLLALAGVTAPMMIPHLKIARCSCNLVTFARPA